MRQDITLVTMVGIACMLFAGGLLIAWRLLRLQRTRIAQLQRALADMETAYANAPLGLAMFDTNLRYLRINNLLAQLNGISAPDHIGKTIQDIVPDLVEHVEERFLHVIRTGEPSLGIVFEGMTSAQPGVPRSWRENAYPMFDEHGKVVGISVAVEEITEEKRLNDALRASETRERERASELWTVMNATPAAILLSHDRSCRHMSGNPESCRLLRLPPGGNASATAPDADDARPFVEYANGVPLRPDQLPMQVAAATGEEVRGVELEIHFRNGDVIYLLSNAAPLRNHAGEVIGAVGACIDVTARKQAEQALQQENQRKDEFLATLAHELRNPLAAIQTGLELLKLASDASPAQVRTRNTMERQLSHLVRLIDDLLDVSRISFGKLTLKTAKVSVRDIIDSAVEVSRLQVETSGHAIDVALPAAPLYVQADLVRMAQVISNLLNNAAKYTPDGGHIRVRAERDGIDAVIHVIDNGIGIEKDMLDKVFDMFSQVESASDHRKGGIGVGLSLARQLVEMHGGTLEAESGGSGTGSTFTVRLPLRDGAAADIPQESLPSDAPSTARGRRILIVDDNQDAAQMLGTLLELGGHTVRLAYSGRSALDVAKAFQPELTFLDIGMPDMNGHEVAKAMRNDHGIMRATLVALTGWGSGRDRAESKEAGFDYHLTKPVTLDAIRSILPELALPQNA